MGLLIANGMDPMELFHRYSFAQLDFISSCVVRREMTRLKMFGGLFGVKFKDPPKEGPEELTEEQAKQKTDALIGQLSQLQGAVRKLRR